MKYRLVKDTYSISKSVNFVIEKKRRFFKGWSRNYLWSDYSSYYEFSNEKEALQYLDCLNGITPWISTEIIKS